MARENTSSFSSTLTRPLTASPDIAGPERMGHGKSLLPMAETQDRLFGVAPCGVVYTKAQRVSVECDDVSAGHPEGTRPGSQK
jgi:hypothetical protein